MRTDSLSKQRGRETERRKERGTVETRAKLTSSYGQKHATQLDLRHGSAPPVYSAATGLVLITGTRREEADTTKHHLAEIKPLSTEILFTNQSNECVMHNSESYI